MRLFAYNCSQNIWVLTVESFKTRLDKLIMALFHIQQRPGMYVFPRTHESMANLMTGVCIGAESGGIHMGNIEKDNIWWDVILDFGFEYSPQSYWDQMADAGKSDDDIIDMIIKVHVEVLRRRYNYSEDDIRHLKDKYEEMMLKRRTQSPVKHTKTNNQAPNTNND